MLNNFNYNGRIIAQREDGFINLTQMCESNGKRIDNFLRLKQTKEYISSLENSLTSEVVQKKEGNSVDSGTWGHPSLAINLARWISSDFAVWCDAHIFNLMKTGSTSIEKANPQPQLPQNYLEALEALVASEKEKILLQQTIAEEKPLVEFARRVTFSEGCVDFNTYAKTIGYSGRNRLMKKLREIGVLMKDSTLPYQKWVSSGYFVVKQTVTEGGQLIAYAVVTGKGQTWLYKRLEKFSQLEQRTVKAIAGAVSLSLRQN